MILVCIIAFCCFVTYLTYCTVVVGGRSDDNMYEHLSKIGPVPMIGGPYAPDEVEVLEERSCPLCGETMKYNDTWYTYKCKTENCKLNSFILTTDELTQMELDNVRSLPTNR